MNYIFLIFMLFNIAMIPEAYAYCIYFVNKTNTTFYLEAIIHDPSGRSGNIATERTLVNPNSIGKGCYNWADIQYQWKIQQAGPLYISKLVVKYFDNGKTGHVKFMYNENDSYFESGSVAYITLEPFNNYTQIKIQGYKYPSGMGGSSSRILY